jgi:hypothetical protein
MIAKILKNIVGSGSKSLDEWIFKLLYKYR